MNTILERIDDFLARRPVWIDFKKVKNELFDRKTIKSLENFLKTCLANTIDFSSFKIQLKSGIDWVEYTCSFIRGKIILRFYVNNFQDDAFYSPIKIQKQINSIGDRENNIIESLGTIYFSFDKKIKKLSTLIDAASLDGYWGIRLYKNGKGI